MLASSSCSRALTNLPSHLTPISSVRYVGFSNKKTTFKRKDGNPAFNSSVLKRSQRLRIKDAYADVPHNVLPLISSLEPDIGHQLYSKFCLEILKNYGFDLQFQGSQKSYSRLEGQWNLPGQNFNVVASCSLNSKLEDNRNNDQILLNPPDIENTVGILINNVGFKVSTIRKFVKSENPCILLSVFDKTENWMSEPSQAHWKPEKVQKCLHKQLWDSNIGFGRYRLGEPHEVTVPKCNMTQGMSLCLFNKAFASIAPSLSPGKLVFQRPDLYQGIDGLRSKHQSTILIETNKPGEKSKKMDLCDVVDENRQKQLEQYYTEQIRLLRHDVKRNGKLEDMTLTQASAPPHPSSDMLNNDYSQLMYEYEPILDILDRSWRSR